MNTVGEILKIQRLSKDLLLRQVSFEVDIDSAILSKIERNERRPTEEQIEKLAVCLNLNCEELLLQLRSDKIAAELQYKSNVCEILSLAEKKVHYLNSTQA